MTVQEIFETYRIMPGLQLHQLRVAAVGKTITDHFDQRIDSQSVVLACLFHDMGNIIKSDLGLFTELLGEQGREYWEGVKKEYVEKYGSDEHVATIMIARELELPERVARLMDSVGFSNMERIRDAETFEVKIVEYGDSRVAPFGIRSMDDRLEDARLRYADKFSIIPRSRERFDELLAAAHEIERQIFAHTDIAPEELTEEALLPTIAALREYKVA